ncbi:uncharacterized protein [Drosophila virilis]|uniref:uncharacterized protein isoform X13 n=1 Tax=Drosophila virilis TaxID=7244 RepID=UPI0038B287DC
MKTLFSRFAALNARCGYIGHAHSAWRLSCYTDSGHNLSASCLWNSVSRPDNGQCERTDADAHAHARSTATDAWYATACCPISAHAAAGRCSGKHESTIIRHGHGQSRAECYARRL